IVFEKTIANGPEPVRRTFKKLKKTYPKMECCYEASGCGFVLQRELASMKIDCKVVGPSRIPKAPSDRVKTDRLDAVKLAKLLWSGQLTFVQIPTEQEESTRSLVRFRESKMEDVKRSKQRLLKFVQSRGLRWEGKTNWTKKHLAWLRLLKFEGPEARVFEGMRRDLDYHLEELRDLDKEIQEVAKSPDYEEKVNMLRCLKGVDILTAMVLLVEIGDCRRFPTARLLMSYLGLTPNENSSGGVVRRGGITKSGSKRARRILVEAAWHYRWNTKESQTLRERRKGQPDWVVEHSRKAQKRLCERFYALSQRKDRRTTAVAVARELAGFVWALQQPREVVEEFYRDDR
ncbi:MAG: IS110 family transposase, partial [Candidatus Omnitrophica bacterium]|nr:IS110 family transposase [Candidatus Omnitrophota bacterium]